MLSTVPPLCDLRAHRGSPLDRVTDVDPQRRHHLVTSSRWSPVSRARRPEFLCDPVPETVLRGQVLMVGPHHLPSEADETLFSPLLSGHDFLTRDAGIAKLLVLSLPVVLPDQAAVRIAAICPGHESSCLVVHVELQFVAGLKATERESGPRLAWTLGPPISILQRLAGER